MKSKMKHVPIHLMPALILILFSPALKAQNSMILDQINQKFTQYTQEFPGERIYLHVDKTLYQPGEKVWFTAYLRNSSDLKVSRISDVFHVILKNEAGKKVQELQMLNRPGCLSGDIKLDEFLSDGDYFLEAFTRWQRNESDPYVFRKQILIKRLIEPQIYATMESGKNQYSKGELYTADIQLFDHERNPIAEREGFAEFSTAEDLIKKITFRTDNMGHAKLEAIIPENLPDAELHINLGMKTGGIVEQVNSSIPVISDNLDMQFYPEGGDLVVGLPGRIAFTVTDEFVGTVPVSGYVIDKKGVKVATFKSIHKGMGVFSLIPSRNDEYTAFITDPVNVAKSFRLPAPLPSGISLQADIADEQKVNLVVNASQSQKIQLACVMYEQVRFSEVYALQKGKNEISLDMRSLPMGIAQITLLDEMGIPRVERLLFVNRDKQLKVQLIPDKTDYSTYDKVGLDIQVNDYLGQPVTGAFSVSVTDDHMMTASGLDGGNILAGLLLAPDISGSVDDPSFYFDPEQQKAGEALDLLLMTRGWRHFTWQEITSGQKPVITYDPEKAVIEGYVFNDTITQRVKNLKIEIQGVDYTVKTDKHGYFRLEGIDLSEEVLISFKDINRNLSTYLLTKYSDSVLIDISKNYEFIVDGETKVKSEKQVQFVSSGTASIKGQITDVTTGEPLPFTNISAESNGIIISGTTSDDEGFYTLKPLPPGKLDIHASYMGYPAYSIKGVELKSEQVIYLDIEMDKQSEIIEEMTVIDEESSEEDEQPRYQVAVTQDDPLAAQFNRLNPGYFSEAANLVSAPLQTATRTRIAEKQSTYELPEVVVRYNPPIIDIDQRVVSLTVPADVIRRMPNQTTAGIVTLAGGVFSADGEVGSIRGARPDQTVYYIDGVRVIGNNNVPPLGIAEIKVLLGGIPAEYGDTRGGVVKITTKSPNMYYDYEPRTKTKEIINLPQMPVYHRVREFPVVAFSSGEPMADTTIVSSTIFWDGRVALDENGKGRAEFYTSRAATDFRITLEGISDKGEPGHAVQIISAKPELNK